MDGNFCTDMVFVIESHFKTYDESMIPCKTFMAFLHKLFFQFKIRLCIIGKKNRVKKNRD